MRLAEKLDWKGLKSQGIKIIEFGVGTKHYSVKILCYTRFRR
jgi:hypothetical protein